MKNIKKWIVTLVFSLLAVVSFSEILYWDYTGAPVTQTLVTDGSESGYEYAYLYMTMENGAVLTGDSAENPYLAVAGQGYSWYLDSEIRVNSSYLTTGFESAGTTINAGAAWSDVIVFSLMSSGTLSQSGYIGLADLASGTQSSGTFNYGWARVQLDLVHDGSSVTSTLTVFEMGFNSEVGQDLSVGAVPEPASIALLGLAGVIIAGYRRFLSV